MVTSTVTDSGDIIAAVATPPGRGGVGIVRISGPSLTGFLSAFHGGEVAPRKAVLTDFADGNGEIIDQGLLLYFPAPHSFTGEDVIELQGHGGPLVMDALLQRVLDLGARPARPGEFSLRAFINDKMDLAQAEAIADLIDASTRQAARGAMRSLQGEFSRLINGLVERLIQLRVYIEAAIDFPDEEIDFLSDGRVAADLASLTDELTALLQQAQQGVILGEGMTVVIAGKPNAGKSSLLNALSGRDTAIVTEVAGTTRDVLRERYRWYALACSGHGRTAGERGYRGAGGCPAGLAGDREGGSRALRRRRYRRYRRGCAGTMAGIFRPLSGAGQSDIDL